jgi:aminoglycoside phosphotransferase (APT) family kinase protein
VSAELERALAALLPREIPGCDALVACERLSGGASHETYRLAVRGSGGDRLLALRRAPGGVPSDVPGRPRPALQARLMQCARAAGVPEPEVLYVLRAQDGLGEGFLMEWLEGETLGARVVRAPSLDAVRPRLAYQCGEILARIHAVDVAQHGLAEGLERVTPETFVRQTWERYQALGTPQPVIDFTARWLLEHLPRVPELRLVHNDFRNGNLIVAPRGVVAVLDWELAHVGDPMRDLGWICTPSWRFGRADLPVGGFGTYADLFAGYTSVSGEKVDAERVRFWEIFGSFWWSVGCLGMVDHYRSGVDRSVEQPAIGRRSSECQVDCVNLLIPGPVELVAAGPRSGALDLPPVDELVASVRDFLRGDVAGATQGRTSFLARVAANSLDVALRELALGAAHRARQSERLRALLGREGELDALRTALCERLRDGSLALDAPGLADYLRESAVNQLAIDQPGYAGLRTALARGGPGA